MDDKKITLIIAESIKELGAVHISEFNDIEPLYLICIRKLGLSK
jgi:hypothetical protein